MWDPVNTRAPVTPCHCDPAESLPAPLSTHTPITLCPSCRKTSCLLLAFNLLLFNFVDCLFFPCKRKKEASDLPFLECSKTRKALSGCLLVVIFPKASSHLSSGCLQGRGFFCAPKNSLHLLKPPITEHSLRCSNHAGVNGGGEQWVLSASCTPWALFFPRQQQQRGAGGGGIRKLCAFRALRICLRQNKINSLQWKKKNRFDPIPQSSP